MLYWEAGIIGLAAGILGAVLGLGGGVVMLPASQYLLGIEPLTAVGTTLVAVIFTSASGAYNHYTKGNVNIKSGLLIGLGGLVGVLAGSYIFKKYLSVDIRMLEVFLGLLFAFMTIRMGYELVKQIEISRKDTVHHYNSWWAMIIVGLVTGVFSGIMGLGGGFIMVPAMMWLFAANQQEAAGTTLLAMLPIALLGGFLKFQQGYVNTVFAIFMGLGTVLGTGIGVRISDYVKPAWFRVIFSIIFGILSYNYLF